MCLEDYVNHKMGVNAGMFGVKQHALDIDNQL